MCAGPLPKIESTCFWCSARSPRQPPKPTPSAHNNCTAGHTDVLLPSLYMRTSLPCHVRRTRYATWSRVAAPQPAHPSFSFTILSHTTSTTIVTALPSARARNSSSLIFRARACRHTNETPSAPPASPPPSMHMHSCQHHQRHQHHLDSTISPILPPPTHPPKHTPCPWRRISAHASPVPAAPPTAQPWDLLQRRSLPCHRHPCPCL